MSQVPVHEESRFTVGEVAGKKYLISEVYTLDPNAGDRGPFSWATFGEVAVSLTGLVPGATRFKVRNAATQTVTEFVFTRQRPAGPMEFRASDGSIAHVYSE